MATYSSLKVHRMHRKSPARWLCKRLNT